MSKPEENYTCKFIPIETEQLTADLLAWFESQPSVGKPAYLLVHAEDGLTWGELRDGKLTLSSQAFPQVSPPLSAVTLQQAFLFGSAAQVHTWREGDTWHACRLEDSPAAEALAFDETYLLWGMSWEGEKDGFTLLSEDGRLRHAVPLKVEKACFNRNTQRRPVHLQVRHYIEYDPHNGQARIAASRLVGFEITQGG